MPPQQRDRLLDIVDELLDFRAHEWSDGFSVKCAFSDYSVCAQWLRAVQQGEPIAGAWRDVCKLQAIRHRERAGGHRSIKPACSCTHGAIRFR